MWRSPLRGVSCTSAVLLSLCQGELLRCEKIKTTGVKCGENKDQAYPVSGKISTKENEVRWQSLCTPLALTLFQHANFEALGEAACLASLPAPLGDLALVRCRTAVLDVT